MKLHSVNTNIWSDEWFRDKLSPDQKLVWVNLLTNDKINLLGIYEVSVRKIMFETGLSEDQVKNALHLFIKDKKILFKKTYIILRNHIKNNSYNTNMFKSVISTFNELPLFVKEYEKILHKDDVESSILIIKKQIEKIFTNIGKDSATIRNASETIRKEEDEVEEENKFEDEKESSLFDIFLKIWNDFYLKVNPNFPYKETDKEDDDLNDIINYFLSKVCEGDADKACNIWQTTLDNFDKWGWLKKRLTIKEVNINLNNILNEISNVTTTTKKSSIAQNFEALYSTPGETE